MIRLGVIGTGSMARHQAQRLQKIRGVKLTACCDLIEERARAYAKDFGIPKVYVDYKKMLRDETLDAITNVTSDDAHAMISIAAAKRGLHVLCEKPLATNLADARKMAAAVKQAAVVNMVNFSYRNSCALQAAAKVIAAGRIGRVMHVEASYLQSWLVSRAWGNWRTADHWTWRLSKRHGSQGTLGDIGCHIYDLTTLLAGDVVEVYSQLKTFDKGVKGERIGEYVLDANDSFVSNVVFKNGALGTIHSTRWATGHDNSLRARVYGDQGAIEIDLDRSYDEYLICTGKNVDKAEWKPVKCKATPNNFQRFIRAIKTGKADPSDFANALRIQAYLHYTFLSAEKRKPVKVRT